MSIEIKNTANVIINDYLSGAITAIDRDKRLKRNGVNLYYLLRGKGKIKAVISFNGGTKETLNF